MNWNAFAPLPPIDAATSYLVLQPHSDDAVWFAGGLLLKLTGAGTRVTLVTMTDGTLGTIDPTMTRERLKEVRRDEDRRAGEALGIARHIYLPFRDGSLPRCGDATRAVVRLIRQEKPEALLAPDPWLPYEAHQDHLNCGWAGAESLIYCHLPLYMPELPPHTVRYIAFYLTAHPNQVVDVAQQFEQQSAILGMFASQFTPDTLERTRQYLRLKAEEVGRAHGMALAEAYKVLTPWHLHTNVDTEAL